MANTAKKKVPDKTLRKVLHYIRRYRVFLVLSILLAGATVAGTLYVPILVGNAIDRIVAPGAVDFGAVAAILLRIGIVIQCADHHADREGRNVRQDLRT